MLLLLIIAVAIAYALGSISPSVLLAKIQGQPDPRTQGSGNAGATNVLRNSGKGPAAIVLVCDVLKGWLAVCIARFLLGVHGSEHDLVLGIVAVAVVAGHIFPIFFKFKGGKGVATYLGALLGISFMAAFLALVVWIIVALVTKYSSLASLIAVASGCVLTLFMGAGSAFVPLLAAVALVAWKHSANIQRLRNGTENKLR